MFTVLRRSSNIRHNKDIKDAIHTAGLSSSNENDNDKNKSKNKNNIDDNANKQNKNDDGINTSLIPQKIETKNEKKNNANTNTNTDIHVRKNFSSGSISSTSELVQAVRSASMTNSEYKKKYRAANAQNTSVGGRSVVRDMNRNLDEGVIEVFRSFR